MNQRTRISCALLGLAFSTVPGLAQESRGTVLGRITDASGAVVPGAALQITNTQTGVTLKGQSNGAGNYFFSFLNPARYRFTAEHQGFKRTVRDDIEVNVGARLELNITLEVGAIADTLTVTGEAELLDTTNASLGRIVDSKETRELPLNHGNPFNLIRLSAGVNFTDQALKDQPWQTLNTNYAMAGSRAGKTEFTLDGASNTLHDQARGSVAAAWTPPSDTVAEFKIQTATFDVTTGQTEGGVVNISLKSGANKFHGSGYWGKQTPGMNANLWFSNRNGQARGDFKYNRIGGTLSGPVEIPKLYNGKNKTFFLFSYEWIKSVTANGSILTVPPAAQRNGDFSALLAIPNTGSSYQIYDPNTRIAAAGGRFSNSPVPGNIIPASRISPIAKSILGYYALPDQKGTADEGNNLNRSNWRSLIPYRTHLYKFDHIVSEKNRLMFRTNFRYHNVVDTDFFGFDNPSLGTFFWNESASFAFDDVHSFSSTLVMDVKVSDSRFVRAQDTQTRSIFNLSSLGLPSYLQSAIDPALQRFPSITINGETSLGPRTFLYKTTETRIAAVSFDKIRGKQTYKFGGEYRQYPLNQRAASASTGTQLVFNADFTRGPLDNSPASLRGQGLAALLFGQPTGGTLTLPFATNFAESSRMFAGYFQDDWKLTRKLTVNFGLRYEIETAETERYNRSSRGFDPTLVQPFEATALAAYAASYAKAPTPELPPGQFSVRGGQTFAGVGGQPRALYNADKNNFMPRIGMAYSADTRTVIRGGFGMYFGSLGTRLADVIQPGFSRSTAMVPSLDGGITFGATLSNPFPNGFLPPVGAADGAATNVGNAISFFNPNPKAARLHKWQIDIQRELPGRFVFELGYSGARNRELEVARQLSALPNKYLSTSPARDQATINYLTASVASPFAGIPQFNSTSLTSNLIARSALLSPFPQFNGVSYFTYDGKSWYDAMNVRLEKRFSKGYTVVANYTFSKFLEATTLLNPGDTDPSKVISDQDFPHHFSVTSIFELPVGRGKRFLPNAPRAVDAILGGWQISPVYTYQSGQAIPFGNVIIKGDLHSIPLSSGDRNVDHWFNTGAFNTVNAEQLANNLRTVSLRFNGIRGDAYNYWDISALKNTKIRDSMMLEFRFEALNALNQVNFALPNATPNNTAFGQVTAQLNVPRHMQMTLRLQF